MNSSYNDNIIQMLKQYQFQLAYADEIFPISKAQEQEYMQRHREFMRTHNLQTD